MRILGPLSFEVPQLLLFLVFAGMLSVIVHCSFLMYGYLFLLLLLLYYFF